MEHNDAEWVSQSLAGSREAFARIVEAYQALVCSLAYSATGDLCQSEDLAQETFLIAWKELRQLREPDKLRPWLCRIARSVIGRASHRQAREPAYAGQPLEVLENTSAAGPSPAEGAINREEEVILWRSLARIPEIYREPLVLFYREEQSVASVAEKLELSQDAVKQRLSRGRKLLTEEVRALVEGMLKRTAPGKAFTLGVITALPAFTISAKAATLGAAASKGGAAAKAAASLGFAGAIFGPLLGILGGLLGARMSIENTRSPRERQFMINMAWIASGLAGLFCLAVFAFVFAVHHWWKEHPLPVAVGFIAVVLAYGVILAVLVVWGNRVQQRIRKEESAKSAPGALPSNIAPWEYRSRWMPLGLPLIHIRLGFQQNGRLLAAKGWIAIGETAFGALVGLGSTFALAPISLGGGAAVGVLALGGGAAAGVLSLGGGLALGLLALGGCAVGWTAAFGGMAVAHDYALGGAAYARHANDIAARAAIQNNPFFSTIHTLTRLHMATPLPCPAPPSSSTLSNGIRVVSVYFPGSTNVSIFTFLPLGLVKDGPGQTQWSHLVEHLAIRSTVPAGLSMANAETLPDHVRLDFYGNIANWKQGLSHHRRWLEGVPFTQANLDAEKPNVKSECDYTAQHFFTHKFALAAWAQGFRHGRTHAAVQGDIERASLSEIQTYRDTRLAALTNIVVCVVGGLDPAEVRSVVPGQLGAIKSSARPVAMVQLHPGDREMTWDLKARHLVITWPIPGSESKEFPALLLAAQWLNVQMFRDVELKTLTGQAFAGADLAIPEGNFFYISASLRPDASFKAVQENLEQHIRLLNSSSQDLAMLPALGQQLAQCLQTIPDLAALRAQLPATADPAMLEGNIGLQWGMNEYRYGPHRTVLAKGLSELTAQDVQRASSKYLSHPKCSAITLRPLTL